MKSSYLVFAAATALTLSATTTSVSAKTKSATIKVAKVMPGDKYVTGKVTPGSKVTISRYSKIYASGKANKAGIFKLKSKYVIKGNWHYRATSIKKGYKTKIIHFGVKTAPVASANIAQLQNQLDGLLNQLSNLKGTSDAQLASLNAKINDLQQRLNQSSVNNQNITESKDISEPNAPTAEYQELKQEFDQIEKELNEKKKLLENWYEDPEHYQSTINYQQQEINHLEQELTQDPDNQTLQLKLSDLRESLKSNQQTLKDVLTAKEKIGNGVMDLKNEIETLEKQYWDLYNKLGF